MYTLISSTTEKNISHTHTHITTVDYLSASTGNHIPLENFAARNCRSTSVDN